jgi:hypothetical protein
MAIALIKRLEPKIVGHRAVRSAYLAAVVEGDTIVGWAKTSAFSVQAVLPDGKITPLDLAPAKLALQADIADMKGSKAGIVGISSLIAERRIQEQTLETFHRSCVKPHSRALQYKYWTEFRVIPSSGCVCTITEMRKIQLLIVSSVFAPVLAPRGEKFRRNNRAGRSLSGPSWSKDVRLGSLPSR